jgi:hypothetical protein
VQVAEIPVWSHGLKQLLEQWYKKFNSVMLQNGFVHGSAKQCISYKTEGESLSLSCMWMIS